MPSYQEIEDAIFFTDAAFRVGGAFYDPVRDAVYLKGSDLEEDKQRIPADVDWERCIRIPGEKQLDLGRALIERFVREIRPSDCDHVRGFFARRGAYRRFRAWVESHGLQDHWHAYRTRAERDTILAWCAANRVTVQDVPEAPELPAPPPPCGPEPRQTHPPVIRGARLTFIANTVTRPNIVVGDYTYTDDAEPFENRVLCHDPALGDKLIIGKFTIISSGVRFIMNGASHRIDGFSAYPFWLFGQGWEGAAPTSDSERPFRGDTVIGNDVWIGYEALILPGVHVGDGAIISARAVVAHDVPPYAVVAGTPATVVRSRFPDDVTAELVSLAWWHWDAAKITRNVRAIAASDLAALKAAH